MRFCFDIFFHFIYSHKIAFLHISWLVYSLCCVRISSSFERKFKFLKRLLSGKTFVLSCRWLCFKVESNVKYLCIRILCELTSKEKTFIRYQWQKQSTISTAIDVTYYNICQHFTTWIDIVYVILPNDIIFIRKKYIGFKEYFSDWRKIISHHLILNSTFCI